MKLTVEHTAIPDVLVLRPTVFRDGRGWFAETFNEAEFASLAHPVHFVQDNESRSSYGVVRGLHFQKGAASQGKLVRVIRGRVLDVAVDLRVGSPWFGRWVAEELNDENFAQLFIPRGFAHGFSVLSDEAVFQYKCDRPYAPEAEAAVAWDDPALGIDWGIPADKVLLSPKDACHPVLASLPAEDLFDYSEDLYK